MSTKAEEKLLKARIRLQSRSPFFSYLSFFIKFKESKERLMGRFDIGIALDGTIEYYAPWVENLPDEQLIGVLCHEIMHLALLHLIRRKEREHIKFNIACDIGINAMLVKNGFELPKEGIIPVDDEWEIPKAWLMAEFTKRAKNSGGFLNSTGKKKIIDKITDCSKRTAEEIYDMLPDIPEGMKIFIRGNAKAKGGKGEGSEGESVGGWDKHEEQKEGSGSGKGDKKEDGEEGSGKPFSEAEKNEIENEWLNRLEEAYIHSKQRGKVPLGLERYIDEIKKSQLDWKTLLQKYMLALIPQDYTWSKRSKKSMALESYLPSVKKDKIDVLVGIDTSGSIGKQELTDFVTEIIGMARAYKDKMSIRVMCHDVDVHTNDEVKNGSIDKIKKIQIKGGGGTSHKPLFKKIEEDFKDAKVLICFTDGYSDLDSIRMRNYKFAKIFVISKEGTEEQLKKHKGDCIVLKIK